MDNRDWNNICELAGNLIKEQADALAYKEVSREQIPFRELLKATLDELSEKFFRQIYEP